MRETFPVKLLLQLFQATSEELVAIERILGGHAFAERQTSAPKSAPYQAQVEGTSQAGSGCREGCLFRWRGRRWEVVWCGGRPFPLRNTLGARYLNYLVHEPNEPIRAFDLEVAVQPEKGEARVEDSIQPESDTQAMREYRQALGRLMAERAAAQAAGDQEEVQGLDGEIAALESVLKGGSGAADTGERARNNVRKAIAAVIEQLREGGPEERAFADHLRNHLSIGHECL